MSRCGDARVAWPSPHHTLSLCVCVWRRVPPLPPPVAQPPLDAQPASVYRDDMGCSANLGSGDGVQGCVCHLDMADSADGGYTVADDVAECGQARWHLECFKHTRLSPTAHGARRGRGLAQTSTHTGTPPEQPVPRGGHAALEAERVLLSVQLALERRRTRLCTTPPPRGCLPRPPPALRCARARR